MSYLTKKENKLVERERRDSFRDLLIQIGASQEQFDSEENILNVYTKLSKIYSGDFKHFYSDIFSVLTQLIQDTEKGNIDVLGQNIYFLRHNYNSKTHNSLDNLTDILKKLDDHISLEIARIRYSDNNDSKLLQEDKIRAIESQVVNINSQTSSLEKDIQKYEEKLLFMQKEYISILGIFAAIVITFTATIAFSSSVLEHMHTVSTHKALLVIVALATVFINIVYALFTFIKEITKINFDSSEKKANNSRWFFINIFLIIFFGSIILLGRYGVIDTSPPSTIRTMNSTQNNHEYNIYKPE